MCVHIFSGFRDAQGCSQSHCFPNHPPYTGCLYYCQMWKYLGENGYHSSKLSCLSGSENVTCKVKHSLVFPLCTLWYNSFHHLWCPLSVSLELYAIPQSPFFSILNNCQSSNYPWGFNDYITQLRSYDTCHQQPLFLERNIPSVSQL